MIGSIFAYMANRKDGLAHVLDLEHEALSQHSTQSPSGWGIGFYQGGEVLHKKRPLLEGERLDWSQVAQSVRSDCAVVYLRRSAFGDFQSDNVHPFRMRSWLFAHNGAIERFDAVRGRLLETMPDFLRRNIRGDTDSEHFFHTILSFLHDAGTFGAPTVEPREVLNALRSAVVLVDRLCAEVGASPSTLNAILTNGERMYALRRGAPFIYADRTMPLEPVSSLGSSKRSRASTIRYAVAVSNGATPASGYKTLDDSSVLIVSRNLELSVHAI